MSKEMRKYIDDFRNLLTENKMEKISMRKIKEVFRLRFEQKLSNVRIAGSLNIGETTVEQYVFRAKRAGLTWPALNDLGD